MVSPLVPSLRGIRFSRYPPRVPGLVFTRPPARRRDILPESRRRAKGYLRLHILHIFNSRLLVSLSIYMRWSLMRNSPSTWCFTQSLRALWRTRLPTIHRASQSSGPPHTRGPRVLCPTASTITMIHRQIRSANHPYDSPTRARAPR